VVRKNLMALALAFWSMMTALSGLATGFLTLVVLRMGVAVGESCCSPTTLSLLSDYFPRERRGLAFAIWSTSVPVGTMLALVGGGWLTAMMGWREAFVILGVAGLLLVPAVLRLKEPPRGQFDAGEAKALDQPSLAEAVAFLWRLRSVRWLLAAAALQAFVVCALQVWSAPFYTRVFGMSVGEVGLVLGILFGVGGGAGALLGGWLADRAAKRDVRYYAWLPAGSALALIPLGLIQYHAPTPVLSVAAGAVGFVMLSFYLSPLNVVTQSLVAPRMRAFMSSIVILFSNLIGLGLGPLATGMLSDALVERGLGDQSLRWALSATVLVAGLAAFAFAGAGRHLRRELR
jgi:predicted MFS family arabinose efflux permease